MLARLRGGHLQVSLAPPGSNRLILPVLPDRDRALDLWLDPAGLLHHKRPAPRQPYAEQDDHPPT